MLMLKRSCRKILMSTLPGIQVKMSEMDKKLYLCNISGATFPDLDRKLHLCKLCGETIKEDHTDIKPNLCKLCGETFIDLDTLIANKE